MKNAHVPDLLYARSVCLITMLGQYYAHEGVMEGSSNSHSLGLLHFQAKEIIYNVNRYFIAEKVKKGTLTHRKFEVRIRFGNAAYCMATQQLERG